MYLGIAAEEDEWRRKNIDPEHARSVIEQAEAEADAAAGPKRLSA